MGYSLDLRMAVVEAHENRMGTREELSELFQIGPATLGRWVRRFRATGSPKPLPRGGGNRRRIGNIGETILLGLLEKQPDATLVELASQYSEVTRMPMSRSVISDMLGRLNITRKKRQFLRANETVNGFREYVRSM